MKTFAAFTFGSGLLLIGQFASCQLQLVCGSFVLE